MSGLDVARSFPNQHDSQMSGSEDCPSTHPYAFDDGGKCCSKFVRDAGCAEGSSGELQFEDSASCCVAGDTSDCAVVSQGRVCTSREIGILPKNPCFIVL